MADDTPISLGPVLVTGGCGFIGANIVRYLRANDADCDLHVLDINIEHNTVLGATYHICDITDATAVHALMEKVRPRTIFHLACPDSMKLQPHVFHQVNVVGARNLVAAAQAVGTQAFINTTTSSIVHDNHSNLVEADETFPVLDYPVQKRIYTLTKAQAHKEILAANRKGGDDNHKTMLTASILPSPTFGVYDTTITAKIVSNARAGKANIQMGPGKNYQDFIYISNLIDGHFLVAEALLRAYGKPPPADKRVDGEAFIFTNCERIEFWEFSRSIAAAAGYPVKPEDIKIVPIWVAWLIAAFSELITFITSFGKRAPTITREAVNHTTITKTFNCDKARRVLGYKPKVTIAEGLKLTGKWLKESEGRDHKESNKNK